MSIHQAIPAPSGFAAVFVELDENNEYTLREKPVLLVVLKQSALGDSMQLIPVLFDELAGFNLFDADEHPGFVCFKMPGHGTESFSAAIHPELILEARRRLKFERRPRPLGETMPDKST